MLREATVVLQCILATVSEQEEAHEALVALLRLKDGDLCSRDAELEYLRQRLKERDAILQASGDDVSRKSEQDWVKELADKESEYGTQLGAMTQKNAQMRVELKKLQQELSKTQQELASERTAHAALQKVAVKQAVDRDDGDAELAELDAVCKRYCFKPLNDDMSPLCASSSRLDPTPSGQSLPNSGAEARGAHVALARRRRGGHGELVQSERCSRHAELHDLRRLTRVPHAGHEQVARGISSEAGLGRQATAFGR
jgi:hypothetical protein